jgi:hypothetical protein
MSINDTFIKDPDDISFTGTVNVIKRNLPLAVFTPPERLKEWWDSLIKEIALAKCHRNKGNQTLVE